MTQIHAYLTFNGNCREAMAFYHRCLGGELSLQTVADSPLAGNMPDSMKQNILHSILIKKGLVLMGSDMMDAGQLKRGNTIALMLHCDTELELRTCFSQLAEGGRIVRPVPADQSTGLTGQVRDKFGTTWLLTLIRP